MVPALKKIRPDDSDLARVQDNVGDVLTALVKVPLLQGALVEDVTIGANDTIVNHGLGRIPVGFIVVSPQGAGVVYESPTSNIARSRFLVLKASTAVTTSLWVF